MQSQPQPGRGPGAGPRRRGAIASGCRGSSGRLRERGETRRAGLAGGRPGDRRRRSGRAGCGPPTSSRSTWPASRRRKPDVHAFNLVTDELARATADRVDEAVAAGRDPGPLAGVPVALKDNLCTRGVPTTCSSRILDGWLPPYDATVVQRLVGGGRGGGRQDQPRRVRHGILDGELGLRAHPQSPRPAPGPGRVVGRQRRRRGRRLRPAGPGLGHRRIHSPARRALRRGRSQADLRPGLALRADRLRQLARSDRPACRPTWPTPPCCSTSSPAPTRPTRPRFRDVPPIGCRSSAAKASTVCGSVS